MNYTDAKRKLDGRPSRKLANNTYLKLRDNGDIDLVLHATAILQFKKTGRTIVNTGGWKTSTTKARLNDYMPAGWGISQEKGVWFWMKRGDWSAPRTMFTDGDSINRKGEVKTQAKLGEAKKQLAERRRILAFAKLCADSVPLPVPGPGDCLICQMESQNPGMKDTGHLTSHMEEGYVVPTMVHTALKEAKETDLIMAATFGQAAGFLAIARTRVKSDVASFMFRRFGMVAKGGWGTKPTQGFALRRFAG